MAMAMAMPMASLHMVESTRHPGTLPMTDTAPPPRRVGIYLFDDVEALDFAGPYEVFTTASRVARRLNPHAPPPFEVCAIARQPDAVTARAGLRLLPDHTLSSHPALNVLVVPGGVIDAERERAEVIAWIAAQAAQCELTVSVCTGAFLLAQAGVLRQHRATTHWEDIADLRAQFPALQVLDQVRWVDEGRIISSAGISAGIDMSLHVVARLTGCALAEATARQMDYRWQRASAPHHDQGRVSTS
jgi:transcriptional regulator GlxA family with amidase domain